MNKWKQINMRITATIVALILLCGFIHVFAEDELFEDTLGELGETIGDSDTEMDPEFADDFDIIDIMTPGSSYETEAETEYEIILGDDNVALTGLSPDDSDGLLSGLLPGEGMGEEDLMTLDSPTSGVGAKYGGYTITDVISNTANLSISTSGGVYEVSGSSNSIITVNGASCVIVLNGADRTHGWATLQIKGVASVTLYLVDNKTNTFKATGTNQSAGQIQSGIYVEPGATLIIEGPGKLNAEGGHYGAGIGGQHTGTHLSSASGTIIIESGIVNAKGGYWGAGIGGGYYGAGGTVTINGGTVTANGGTNGAGIGSGYYALEGTTKITINGGTVNATGGAGGGAGIGGGKNVNGGTIAITGGIVEAKSGDSNGSGIGGGGASNTGAVKITGGSVRSLMPNGDIKINNSAPTNGTSNLTLLRIKVVDEDGAIIPGAEISVPLSANNSYNAAANSEGIAYLWLPQGTYTDVTVVNPENEASSKNEVLTIGAPASPYNSNTIDQTIKIKGGGVLRADLSINQPNEKVYLPGGSVTLTLSIRNDSLVDKTINEIKWFRESVSKPVYTHETFNTGYGGAAEDNKGDLPVSSSQETFYSMAMNKNGRYWIQIKFTDDITNESFDHVDRIDIDNIYTLAEVHVRDWNLENKSLVKPYTLLEGEEGASYGIPFDLNGDTIVNAPRLGFDKAIYNRNAGFPVSGWDMIVPGSPFEPTTPGAASSIITLNSLDISKADTGSNATIRYYTVNYEERTIDAIIDLSTTTTSNTSVGYDVSGNTAAFSGNEVTPGRSLTFNTNANDRTFEIVQTGTINKYADSNKHGTSIYNIITVGSNVTVKLIVNNIYLIGSIRLENNAKVTLLLSDSNYVTEFIRVPVSTELTIDSLNKNDATDRLTIPDPVSRDNTYASIGGAGAASIGTDGSAAGKITINGGKIDIISRSTGACIGGGGTMTTPEKPGNGGNGGTITINGGDISVTQHESSYYESDSNRRYVGGAGIGGGGGNFLKGGNGGVININGGKVTVRQHTRGAGIGAGTFGTPGNITISGGDVDVSVLDNGPEIGEGAGIGGSGSNSRPLGETGYITITGGTVKSFSAFTGIGIVNSLGDCHIVITGGNIHAKGESGPGIGYYAFSGFTNRDIKITGGTIVAESYRSAGIGASVNLSAIAPLHLDAAADVRAYSYGNLTDVTTAKPTPAIYTANNTGNGYFVNAGFVNASYTSTMPASFGTQNTDLYVYKDGQNAPLIKLLTLPKGYKFFAYSTGADAARTDNIYYSNAASAGQILRNSDSGIGIFSVKNRNGYAGYSSYNTENRNIWLPIKCNGDNFIIYNSNDGTGNAHQQHPSDGSFTVLGNDVTGFAGSETAPIFVNWNTKADGSGTTYNPGDPISVPANSSIQLYAQWIAPPPPDEIDLTIIETVRGPFSDNTREFSFTVSFFKDKDSGGLEPLEDGTSFSTINDLGVDGELTLENGEVTFVLQDSQSITLKGVPKSCYVVIEEAVDQNYEISFKDSAMGNGEENSNHTGIPRKIEGSRTFEFINNRIEIVPTDIDTGSSMAMVVLTALALSLLLITIGTKATSRRYYVQDQQAEIPSYSAIPGSTT